MSLFWKVIVLSVLQGVTEFLPVSSSGHLVLLGRVLGLESPGATLEIFLHFGTLIAIVVFFRKKLFTLASETIRREPSALREVGIIFVSTLPAVVFFLLARESIEGLFNNSRFVGAALCITGIWLLLTRFAGRKKQRKKSGVTLSDALMIGLAQAVAILPGISRSGATIATARMRNLSKDTAAEFAFLMCIPLIIGATLMECVKMLCFDESGVSAGIMLVGAVVAGVTGYGFLKVLVLIIRRERFWLFGIYCLLTGLVTICLT